MKHPQRWEAERAGCNCVWWGRGSICWFNPTCPIAHLHRHEPEEMTVNLTVKERNLVSSTRETRTRLGQAVSWTDGRGKRHLVREIESGYAVNIILWLEERADRLFEGEILGRLDAGRAYQDLLGVSPLGWLRSQALLVALRRRVTVPAHALALTRSQPICRRSDQPITGPVVKIKGLPYSEESARAIRAEEAAEREARAFAFRKTQTLDFRRLVQRDLAECAGEIGKVHPHVSPIIGDVTELVDIVDRLRAVPTAQILVLGVYLTNRAEETFRQRRNPQRIWGTGKPSIFADEY